MDIHSSSMFCGDTTASILQSCARGFLARRRLGKKKVDSLVTYSENKADKLMHRLIKIAEVIETKWFYSQITPQDHCNALLHLEYIKSCLAVQYHHIEEGKKWSLATKQQVNELTDKLFENHRKYDDSLIRVFEKVGAMSLIRGLKTVIGPLDYETLHPEIKSKIKEYDDFFSPTGCRIYNEVVEEKNGLITFKNSEGNEIIVFSDIFEKTELKFSAITQMSESSILETVNGAELTIPVKDVLDKKSVIVIKGFFKQNPIICQSVVKPLKKKYYKIYSLLDQKGLIPREFRTTYLNLYPVKDLILKKAPDIIKELEADYERANNMSNCTIQCLYTNFCKLNVAQQARMLALLLMKENNAYAIALYVTVARDIPEFARIVRNNLHYTFLKKLSVDVDNYQKNIEKLKKMEPSTHGYEERISIANMGLSATTKAMEKVPIAKGNGHESGKAQLYLNKLLSVPFGIYSKETVNKNSSLEDIQKHLRTLKDILDLNTYGQTNPKKAILEWRGQKIQNGESKGECIVFAGPPGTGKTTLGLGIAKALNRPFFFISLAGLKGGEYFTGFEYTYVAAKPGRPVEILIEAECMDPVIFLDEADKIKSDDIVKILTAWVDFAQNHAFEKDLYFSGIKFDFSRVLFIMSLNDKSLLDPVFKDRLKIIEVDPLSIEEKTEITHRHFLPDILKSCGFQPDEVSINDEDLKYLIENYTLEGGARKLKEKLFSIVRQINLQRLLEPDTIQFPYKIDEKSIVTYLDKPKIKFKKIASKPHVGTVNGLYATTAGIGGLTIIQVLKTLSNERLGLELTGSQGQVMQESMRVARSVAWNIIPKEIQDRIQKDPPEGLHIHCPEGATPKDGPSAGGAITTAIISRLTGIPVRNDVAMTGEIDGHGNITEIGGLDYKLHGAKKAGVRLALVPRANADDIEEIKTKHPTLFDNTFEVKLVNDIYDILDNALVNNPFKRPSEV